MANASDPRENTTAEAEIVVTWLSRYILEFTDRDGVVYLTVVLTILGLVGNAFSLITVVARRLFRRSPIYIYILFINISDLLYTVVAPLIFVFNTPFYETPLYKTAYHAAICRAIGYLEHVSALCSAWVLVAANASKLYALMFPLRNLSQNNERIAWISCGVVCIVLWITYAPFCPAYFMGAIYRKLIGNAFHYAAVCALFVHVYPLLSTLERYYSVFMYSLLPGLFLVILSIVIIFTFRKSTRMRERLTNMETANSTPRADGKNDQFESAKNSIIFLFPMSVLHIACTLPVCVIVILQTQLFCISKYCLRPTAVPYEYVRRLIDINHTVVIYLQLAVSRSFRDAMFGRA